VGSIDPIDTACTAQQPTIHLLIVRATHAAGQVSGGLRAFSVSPGVFPLKLPSHMAAELAGPELLIVSGIVRDSPPGPPDKGPRAWGLARRDWASRAQTG
jgi:hypothetical protein